jgi:CheY-like chemotaxis protein
MHRILFVDDDDDIRTIAHLSLTAVGGWQVTLAESGSRALEKAAQDPPDLIVMDMMMPGMDGLATLQRLREDARTASIPVIFLTAKVQKTEVDRYRSVGAGLIVKPFDPMKLPDEVRRVAATLAAEPAVVRD